MKNIRTGIFETNSSSVHSLVYKNPEWAKPDLLIEDGWVIGYIRFFGRNHEIYEDQNSKLSYLLTCMYCFCEENLDDLNHSHYFKELEEIVIDHTGAKGIKLKKRSKHVGLDHQSYPDYYGECPLFDLTEYNMENFIFNDNIALKTDSD